MISNDEKRLTVRFINNNRNQSLGLLVALGALLLFTVGSISANTYTVSSLANSGTGTLRQAITDANNHPGADIINFSVSGKISPTSELPTLTDSYTLIDASSRWGGTWPNGAPGDTVDGTNAGNGTEGFRINGANYSAIKGLMITNFGANGIYLHTAAMADTIGGTGPGQRNIISGNGLNGIHFSGGNVYDNVAIGNYIGTDASGLTALSNDKNGIFFSTGAYHNIIGGLTAAERNIISGNDQNGVKISGTSVPTNYNVVKGNYIGTKVNGTQALANGQNGILIDASQDTIGPLNVISGNGGDGIWINSGTNTPIKGNYIGLDYTGSANLGNNGNGISLTTSQNIVIGDPGDPYGTNTIAYNTGNGIILNNAETKHILITGNPIYNNGQLAIELIPVSGPNDTDDVYNATVADSGIDFPVVDTALLTGTTLHVAGYVGTSRSVAGTNATFYNCRVEIFKAALDPSYHGEGEIYLGYLMTGVNGNNSLFSGNLNVTGKDIAIGDSLTGTTIDAYNNTSEFGTDPLLGSGPSGIIISSFTAEAHAGQVVARWKTEAEVNTAGFNLYRSPDGSSDYTKLNESLIAAHGDPVTGAAYDYTDPAGVIGNFYKLEVVTLSGGSSFFGPVEATEAGTSEKTNQLSLRRLTAYPNPARNIVYIKYSVTGQKHVRLAVYNTLGQIVQKLTDTDQTAGTYEVTLDAQKLSSGIYFLALDCGGTTQIKRIVTLK